MLHSFAVFITGGNDVNSCSVDTAVTEDISKFGNIFFNAVKHPCEQMPQIVRKHLLRIYSCLLAKPFHFPPDICTAYRFACAGDKNRTCLDFLFRRIAEQFLLQFFHDKYRPVFPFKRYDCFSVFDSLHRYVLQFAHTNTSAANRLQNKVQPLVTLLLCRIHQPHIFRFGQFLFFRAVDLPLKLDGFHPQSVQPRNEKRLLIEASIDLTLRTA